MVNLMLLSLNMLFEIRIDHIWNSFSLEQVTLSVDLATSSYILSLLKLFFLQKSKMKLFGFSLSDGLRYSFICNKRLLREYLFLRFSTSFEYIHLFKYTLPKTEKPFVTLFDFFWFLGGKVLLYLQSINAI